MTGLHYRGLQGKWYECSSCNKALNIECRTVLQCSLSRTLLTVVWELDHRNLNNALLKKVLCRWIAKLRKCALSRGWQLEIIYIRTLRSLQYISTCNMICCWGYDNERISIPLNWHRFEFSSLPALSWARPIVIFMRLDWSAGAFTELWVHYSRYLMNPNTEISQKRPAVSITLFSCRIRL